VNRDRIPVTIIGGYLGAGKTTVVNRILTGDHGRRIAVIVNDFGDVAIDEALLAPAAGGVRALANGCVCCSAADGLAVALAEIRALDPPPEHLLIEVSGVGDPWAVAQWGRTPGFELAGVVVVADPVQVREWADDRYVGEGVRRQLEVADLVLLSRADVTSEESRASVVGWLAEVTVAPVLDGTDLPLPVLLGPTLSSSGRSSPASSVPHAVHEARSVQAGRSSRDRLTRWLESAPAGVVRLKGFVPAVESDTHTWLVQRVGRRYEVVRHELSLPDVVVVITSPAADPREIEDWLGLLRR
jgi:G3E family GTPase